MRCNLNPRSVHETCARSNFVPRLLTDDQREQRHTIAGDLFECSCEDLQFLNNIVTDDESWVYGYDPDKGHVTRVLLIMRVSYTTITLPTGKQLTRHSTWRYCDVSVNQFTETTGKMAGWRLDPAPRQCARAHTHTHTRHILCGSFWPNRAQLSCSSRHKFTKRK